MARRLRVFSDRISNGFGQSERLIDDVANKTTRLYRDGTFSIPEHYRAAAMLSATAVASCLVGFAAGRRRHRRRREQGSTALRPASQGQAPVARGPSLPEMDLSAVFRFLKLWMLYRVATRA